MKPKIINYFKKCSCGEEFLVQLVNNGSNHVMSMIVVCKKCLRKNGINESYEKDNPEEVKKINRWLNEN